MIAWYKPIWLAALALVPLVVLFVWAMDRQRRRALAEFAARPLWQHLIPPVAMHRSPTAWAFPSVVVALLVIGAAGPQWGFRWQEVRGQGIDLVLALDTSRSMLATDVKPNRLARAKLEIEDLVRKLRGDRIALVVFAGTAFTMCPLTLDYNAFLEALRATEVGIVPRGGTSLAAALRTGVDAMEGYEGNHRALVLITDGEDHEGGVDEAMETAAKSGIRVYTVGVGSTEGELIPTAAGEGGGFLKDRRGQVVKSRLDEPTLQRIAERTGGMYVRASSTKLGLDTLYDEALAKLDKRERKSTLEKTYEHRFLWLVVPALLFIALEPRWYNREHAREPQR